MKIDECRIMMNRVMGPNGPMSEGERSYLPNRGIGSFPVDAGARLQNYSPVKMLDKKVVNEKPNRNQPANPIALTSVGRNVKPNAEEEFWY
jgi:hypothetical protein